MTVNIGISEFSAENSDENKLILQDGTIYLGPNWLGREWVDQDISWYRYIRVFSEKFGRKKASFAGGYGLFMAELTR